MTKHRNKQIDIWSGCFGKEYTDRNPANVDELNRLYVQNFNKSRTDINNEFLEDVDRSVKILEVGTNIGLQLLCLQAMGFTNLYGIELQMYAIKRLHSQNGDIKVVQGVASNIPFKDNAFDIVFTSGVLIHISPDQIEQVIKEMYRCSKKYIWGFEYYADNMTEVPYRNNRNLLWKANYTDLFVKKYNHMEIIKRKKYKYNGSSNIDEMYLLQK